MQKVNLILNHPLFLSHMLKNEVSEAKRRFCKHNIAHSMDVARIAYILNLEESLGFDKEMIYAAALLHDITKFMQHESGIPHNESAILPSSGILSNCGFLSDEIELIKNAILHHRTEPNDLKAFDALLFRADKLSRLCLFCEDRADCHWNDEKKNLLMIY